LGIALLVFVCLCGIAIPLAMHGLTRGSSRSLVQDQADLNATLVEGITGIADLVAFGREDLLLGRAGHITAAQQPARKQLAQARGIAAGLTALLVGLAALTVLGFGVSLVSDGSLEGVYLAILPLIAIATFEAVGPLSAAYEHLGRSRAAATRLVELVDTPASILEPSTSAKLTLNHNTSAALTVVDLTVTDLSFRYAESEPLVLQQASVHIPAGSFAVITGSSGSGKSTLCNLLLRFWEYSQGSIQLNECELNRLGIDEARSVVALVAQHDHLFDTTLRDNLLLGDSRADDERLLEACDAVCLGDWVRSLPAGLEERAGENGNRLSGGERQRVMIARALLTQSPILILDEATEHLDEEMQLEVLRGILKWRSGLTTIMITHEAPNISGIDLRLQCSKGTLREI
jgi:ABC-type bacteriocin/lantibiotic exporter with double-glycine peptidase domain